MMTGSAFARCTPEAVGIPSAAILKLLDALEYGGFTEMHGLMILRRGKVCAEGWWAPYAPHLHHALHSLSKTWTATAIGLCEREGLLRVTDRVCDLLPDKMPKPLPERVAKITVRDVLTMSSGSETEKADYSADWIEDFFARPFEHEPGTFWRYNSHGTAILSAIVERVTGQSQVDYLNDRLLRKIGANAPQLMCRRGEDGTCLGGHGLFTTTEDNLRLMKLYLDGGVWDGERLLSEQFVRDAVSPLQDTAPAHAHTPWIYDNCCGYGYQIWRCRPQGSYRADGAFGQFCVVVPALELIVSINETAYLGDHMTHSELHLLKGRLGEDKPVHGPQQTLNALFEALIPAVKADAAALPESGDAEILRQRLSRLSLPRPAASQPFAGERPLDVALLPEGDKISFAPMYGMAKHNAAWPGAEWLHLVCEGGRFLLGFDEGGVRRSIIAEMRGGYATGKLVYTAHEEIVTDVACAAWWEGPDQLQLSIRWLETECEDRFTFTLSSGHAVIRKVVGAGQLDSTQASEARYHLLPNTPAAAE